MPQGMQVWDASGNLILDTTMHIGRLLGTATINSTGSASNAGLATGTPFWLLTCTSAPNSMQPEISVSGTTISWDFTGAGSETFRLVYGVY